MTSEATWITDARWWGAAATLGAGLGLAMAFAPEFAVGGLLVASLLFVFSRSRHRSELLVGMYWIAYVIYTIIFYGVIVRFGFYPFYLAFLLSIVLALRRSGLRVDPVLFWLYAGYMVTMLASFFGFQEPIDSAVVQIVLPHLVGALVLLQFRSREGLRVPIPALILGSLTIAGYVVFRSAQAGFRYRGDIEANPNGAAMVIGFGVLAAVITLLEPSVRSSRRWRTVGLLVAIAAMVYSILLLASRGLAISLLLSILVVVGRTFLRERRGAWVVLVLLVAVGGGLLLPGGQQLVERVTSQEAEFASAGSRFPLWRVTIDSIASGDLRELLFGHGFASTAPVVEASFAGQPSVHSNYLRVFHEFGLLSLVLFVALHAYLLFRGWQIPGSDGLMVLGFSVLLIMEGVTGDVAVTFPFWLAIGYLGAIVSWHAAEPDPGRDVRLVR